MTILCGYDESGLKPCEYAAMDCADCQYRDYEELPRLQVENVGGHNEMCGGYSYEFDVTPSHYGTVAEALDEIREYRAMRAGKGAYRITIRKGFDNYIVESTWIGDECNYHGECDNDLVNIIFGDGGWYCDINFYIEVEE